MEPDSSDSADDRDFEAFLEQMGKQGEGEGLQGGGREAWDCGLPPFEESSPAGLREDVLDGGRRSGARSVVAGVSAEGGAPASRPADKDGTAAGQQKRPTRRRTAHQLHLNKLCQKRYRERQKNRRAYLETMVASLEERTAVFNRVDRENERLKEANTRLAVLVSEQQALLNRRLGKGGSAPSQGGLGKPVADNKPLHTVVGTLQPSDVMMSSRLAICSPHRQQPGSLSRAEAELSAGHSTETHNRLGTSMPPPSPPLWAVSPFSQWTGCQDAFPQQHQRPRWSQASTSASTAGTADGPQPCSSPLSVVDCLERPLQGQQPLAFSPSAGARRGTCPSPTWSTPELGQQVKEGIGNPDVGSAQGTFMDHNLDRFLGRPLLNDVPGVPNLDFRAASAGTPQMARMLGASSAPLPTAFSDSMLLRERSATLLGNRGGVPGLTSVSDLMTEMGIQVQALQSVLATHSICRGGDQVPASVAATLRSMVSTITELEARIARMRTPKPSDLAHSVPLDANVSLSREEMGQFERCLAMLGLSASQESALIELRAGHIAALTKIYEERTRLNAQAKAALRSSGASSETMRSVWDLVKHNIGQEQQAVVDGLCALLLRILEPPQAALLLVDAHPSSVDIIKLTTAVAGLCSDSTVPTSTQV